MAKIFLLILLVISNCVIIAVKTYCMPHDQCWPTISEWHAFNRSVGGALIKLSTPHCSSISEPRIREAKPSCQLWDNTQHEGISLRQPLIHPAYAVHMAQVSDAQAAMNFAVSHNIRLAIKTTGHSFAGRSTSSGSLLVWTHGFNKVEKTENYDDGCSQGAAVTVQGGAIWGDVYPVVSPKYYVVGGYTLSVSVAGGYLQGGGHSPLSPSGGLAVDSVLSMDVVTADGNVMTASPCQNPDLFFALRGGGGGTWGVVTSVTIRMHLALSHGVGFNLLIPTIEHNIAKSFMDTYVRMQPQMHPCWGGYLMGFGPEAILHLYCNADMETAKRSMKPLKKWHEAHPLAGIIWEMNKAKGFWHWHTNLTMPCGSNMQMSSRFVPMENFEGAKADEMIETASKYFNELMFWTIQMGGVVGSKDPNKTSAITPAFRKAQWHMIFARGYIKSTEQKAINKVLEFRDDLEKLAPDSGAYFNEMSYFEPNWKKNFFGDNYDRLLKIKHQVDPNHIMTCNHCVGSDE